MANILIVDDQLSVQDMVSRLLEQAGHRTWTAGSYDEALSLVSSLKLDLVITDLPMTSPEGLTMLSAIQEASSLVTVMVLKGDEERDLPCDGHNAKTDYHLIRPRFYGGHLLLPYDGVGTSILN